MTDTAKPLRFGFAGWGNRGAGLTADLREAMGTKAVTAEIVELVQLGAAADGPRSILG